VVFAFAFSHDRFRMSISSPMPSSNGTYGYWSISMPPPGVNGKGPPLSDSVIFETVPPPMPPPVQSKSNDRSIVSVTFAPVSVMVPVNGYTVSALAESVAKNRIAASSEAFIP